MSFEALRILHGEIDARVKEIAATHGSWPCRKGCDACCRRLADIPRFTQAEWELLKQGIAGLPEEIRTQVQERVEGLAGASRPIVCPFLDLDAGSCLVYDYRPVACRTYGFYVERDHGLYCREIEALAGRGECEGVIWGNAVAVDAKLQAFGGPIDLTHR
jgi:Fe-S-cluster containining protein